MRIIKSPDDFQNDCAYICWNNGTPVINVVVENKVTTKFITQDFFYIKNNEIVYYTKGLPESYLPNYSDNFVALEIDENDDEFWEFLSEGIESIKEIHSNKLNYAKKLLKAIKN